MVANAARRFVSDVYKVRVALTPLTKVGMDDGREQTENAENGGCQQLAKCLNDTWPDVEHLKAARLPLGRPAIEPAVDAAIHTVLDDHDAAAFAAYLKAEELGDLTSLTMLDELGWKEVSVRSGLGTRKVAGVMRAVSEARWGSRTRTCGLDARFEGLGQRFDGCGASTLLCGSGRNRNHKQRTSLGLPLSSTKSC